MMKRAAAVVLGILTLGVVCWLSFPSRVVTRRTAAPATGDAAVTPGRDDSTSGLPVRAPSPVAARKPLGFPTRIEIVDDYGEPLDGVRVSAQLEHETKTLGTSMSGRLLARVDPDARLTASRVGFEDATAEVGDEVPEVIRIVLTMSGFLRGTLLLPDRTPAGEGIHVVAWGGGEERAAVRRSLHGVREGSTPELYAASDAQGRFSIRVPDPTSTYSVTAGGRGFMPLDEVRAVHPDAGPVELVLHPVFAARIQLVEDGGGELHVPNGLWLAPGAVRKECKDPRLRPKYLVPGSIESQLAGIEATWLEGKDTWRNAVTLCTTELDVDAVGPFEIEVRLPGYQAASGDYVALPLAGGLVSTQLALKPTARGWGVLQVELSQATGAGTAFTATDTTWPVAFIVMRQEGGASLRLGVPTLAFRQLEFSDLPWGTYGVVVPFAHYLGRARLGAGHGTEVEIGPEVARLTLDLTKLGSLELEVCDKSGTRWNGEVQASIRADNGRMSDPIGFRGPPYRFQGLEPGTYRVELFKPFRWSPPEAGSAGVAEVAAGSLARVRLTGS